MAVHTVLTQDSKGKGIMATKTIRVPQGLKARLNMIGWHLLCLLSCLTPKASHAKGYFMGAMACAVSANQGDSIILADVAVYNRKKAQQTGAVE